MHNTLSKEAARAWQESGQSWPVKRPNGRTQRHGCTSLDTRIIRSVRHSPDNFWGQWNGSRLLTFANSLEYFHQRYPFAFGDFHISRATCFCYKCTSQIKDYPDSIKSSESREIVKRKGQSICLHCETTLIWITVKFGHLGSSFDVEGTKWLWLSRTWSLISLTTTVGLTRFNQQIWVAVRCKTFPRRSAWSSMI